MRLRPLRWDREASTFSRVALALVASCLALGLLAAPAVAAPTWLAPVDLSLTGGPASEPQVAFDSQGNAVAVWLRSDGTNYVIQSALRPAGGSWQAPVDLSAAGQDAWEPQIAVDAQGNAVAVWLRSNGVNQIIQGTAKPAGGAWGAAVDLSAVGGNASNPHLAMDPQGNAVAVWLRPNGVNQIIQGTTRPAGGAWGAPVDLSATGQEAWEPDVAMDSQGNAVAIWRRYNGLNDIIQSATKPAGGAWGAAVDLSATGHNAEDPHIAADAHGNAVAVWRRSNGANYIIQSATRPAGGAWGAPVDLSAVGRSAEEPEVAMDSQGSAVAVWVRYDGVDDIIQSATSPAGGAWGAPVDLSLGGQSAEEPEIAVDPNGNAVAAWVRYDGSNWTIQGATSPAGGAWGAPVDLSLPGHNAYTDWAAMDLQGNGVVVWERDNGTYNIVQAVGYDAAGPQLNSLSIPARGTAGHAVPFSVSPLDVWSALGSTSWGFGDGATASGTSASHVYARQGHYQVTLSSADALGNLSSATGTIAVAPLAVAARAAVVKQGKALLKLSCARGGASCQGVAELLLRRRRKATRIGKRAFDIPSGRTRVVPVKLNRKGRAGLRHAGPRGLKAKLAGSGVKSRTVVLKPGGSSR